MYIFFYIFIKSLAYISQKAIVGISYDTPRDVLNNSMIRFRKISNLTPNKLFESCLMIKVTLTLFYWQTLIFMTKFHFKFERMASLMLEIGLLGISAI